jgi:hypothetical protein
MPKFIVQIYKLRKDNDTYLLLVWILKSTWIEKSPKRLLGWVTTRSLSLRRFTTLPQVLCKVVYKPCASRIKQPNQMCNHRLNLSYNKIISFLSKYIYIFCKVLSDHKIGYPKGTPLGMTISYINTTSVCVLPNVGLIIFSIHTLFY